MNRIETIFEKLKSEGRKALVTFITAGDPDAAKSASILAALPGSGADIIEIGMPFTDPMADGPAIQAAGLRALEAGANMKQTLKMVQDFRSKNTDTPIVLMGYMNPVLAYGPDAFMKDAAAAGVDGLILVDLPPEEADELAPLAQQNGLHIIRLVTPTTDEARLQTVLNGAGGFLYYVSITGVTGTKSANVDEVGAHIKEIKKTTNLPVVAGFGIKTPEDASAMSAIADGIVVGSAIVEQIGEGADDKAISTQVQALHDALKAA